MRGENKFAFGDLKNGTMEFTDRFVSIPIQAYSIKHEEIYGEKQYFDSYEKIYPPDISSYFESMTDDVRCVQVYLKSGHTFLANCDIGKFEDILNEAQRTYTLKVNQIK